MFVVSFERRKIVERKIVTVKKICYKLIFFSDYEIEKRKSGCCKWSRVPCVCPLKLKMGRVK
jgi:hypothetical protein